MLPQLELSGTSGVIYHTGGTSYVAGNAAGMTMSSNSDLEDILSGNFSPNERVLSVRPQLSRDIRTKLATDDISQDEMDNLASWLDLVTPDIAATIVRDGGNFTSTNLRRAMVAGLQRRFMNRIVKRPRFTAKPEPPPTSILWGVWDNHTESWYIYPNYMGSEKVIHITAALNSYED